MNIIKALLFRDSKAGLYNGTLKPQPPNPFFDPKP